LKLNKNFLFIFLFSLGNSYSKYPYYCGCGKLLKNKRNACYNRKKCDKDIVNKATIRLNIIIQEIQIKRKCN